MSPSLLITLIAGSPLFGIVPLFLWARSLNGRSVALGRAARIAFGLLALVALYTLFSLVMSHAPSLFGEASVSGSAADGARAQAEGISEAMNDAALGFVVLLGVAGWLLFATLRWRSHRSHGP